MRQRIHDHKDAATGAEAPRSSRFAHASSALLCVGLWAAMGVGGGCYAGLGPDDAALDDGASSSAGGSDGGSDDGTDEPVPSECTELPIATSAPLRRLTNDAYANTVRDLLGFEPDVASFEADERIGGFTNNAISPITRAAAEDYMGAAEKVALRAMTETPDLITCDPADPQCVTSWIEDLGRRAWRRPLTTSEVDLLVQLHASGADPQDGVRLVLQALLQSPHFLYLVEVGEPGQDGAERIALTPHEIATRLSYFFWNTMPDEELADVADSGTLTSPEVLREQAERMLDDPRARRTIGRFHRQWLTLAEYELEGVDKDTDVYPEFTQSIREAMATEIELRADYLLRYEDASFEALHASELTIVNDELALLYGLDPAADGISLDPTFELPEGYFGVLAPPTERRGVLGHAGIWAALAKPDNTNIPLRGEFVFEKLLCGVVPPPPADIEIPPIPPPEPGSTVREQLEQQTSEQPCNGCHTLINPFGFIFESYDSIGRHRAEDELGNSIDAQSDVAVGLFEGSFDGPAELAAALATNEVAAECVAVQWYRFASATDSAPGASTVDGCSSARLAAAFAESGHDMRALLVELAVSEGFRYRTP